MQVLINGILKIFYILIVCYHLFIDNAFFNLL